MGHTNEVSSFCNHARTKFGPYLYNIWPGFAFRLVKALKLLRLNLHVPRNMSMECLISLAIPGKCLTNVGAMFGLIYLLR